MRRCRSSRCRHFYPRPPRGGRRSSSKGNGKACKFLSTPSARRATVRQSRLSGSHQISIHALREEGDLPLSGAANVVAIFLSTPSTRRATRLPGGLGRVPDISIHALREEGDKAGEPVTIPINDFYPRPPRGGRRILPCFFPPKIIFLSTPSARRATARAGQRQRAKKRFLSTPSARRATPRKHRQRQTV